MYPITPRPLTTPPPASTAHLFWRFGREGASGPSMPSTRGQAPAFLSRAPGLRVRALSRGGQDCGMHIATYVHGGTTEFGRTQGQRQRRAARGQSPRYGAAEPPFFPTWVRGVGVEVQVEHKMWTRWPSGWCSDQSNVRVADSSLRRRIRIAGPPVIVTCRHPIYVHHKFHFCNYFLSSRTCFAS